MPKDNENEISGWTAEKIESEMNKLNKINEGSVGKKKNPKFYGTVGTSEPEL